MFSLNNAGEAEPGDGKCLAPGARRWMESVCLQGRINSAGGGEAGRTHFKENTLGPRKRKPSYH